LEAPETDYQWYFELYCGDDSSPVYVNGWMQRVDANPDLERQLADEKIAPDTAFANATVWYDAIAAIAALRVENPESAELLERWNALLTAEGVTLNGLPTEPFAGEAIVKTAE
jgi:hypothetical protein